MEESSVKPANAPIAALSYLLGFVSGIILLYLEPFDKDEFVRFHARQSIAFSVAFFAVQIVVGVLIGVLHPLAPVFGTLLEFINLGFAAVWIWLMYKAFNGERYRLPFVADVVDQMGL